MVSIGSVPFSAPKGQVFRTLDDRFAWVCADCGTLNVVKTEPPAPAKGTKYPCPHCHELAAAREAKREARKRQKAEEETGRRWGS